MPYHDVTLWHCICVQKWSLFHQQFLTFQKSQKIGRVIPVIAGVDFIINIALLPELIFVKCYSLFILILAIWGLTDASWLSGSLSDTLGYLGPVCTLLAIRVLSDTLGYPGTVWRSWLSTFHFLPELIFVKCYSLFILILAIWVLPDALGYLGLCLTLLAIWVLFWCSWLSGSWVTLLAIRVLCDALGYTGTVWHSWLSTFHFLPELIFVKCYSLFIFILAIRVLPDALGYLGLWHSWLSGSCLTLLAIRVLSDALSYLGTVPCSGYLGPVWHPWLSTFHFLPELIFVKCYSLFILILAIWVLPDALAIWVFVWHSWLSGSCLMFLAIRVLSDALGYQHFTFCLNWSLSNVILYSF